MSESQPSEQEMEVVSGDKKFKLRGSDLLTSVIGMIVCSGITLLIYISFQHDKTADVTTKAQLEALKMIAEGTKESTFAQREMNCLIALPQESREKSQDLCKRLAR